ncbi:phage major capsid protein [Paracoccus sp. KR1-242]|uniref:phage major capsid protein n=1 Tax=Paracoccus sp. KR1-242 TaxID=3410028 RepID=UPI003BFE270C
MMNHTALHRGIVAVRADAGGDPKAMMAALNQAWEAFKAENETAIKDLKKGQEDVVRTEKMQKLEASVSTLQSALDAQAAQLTALKIGGPGTDGAPKDPEYSNAFSAHFRKGDVQAALNKGADAEGGYLAPIEWDRTITDKLVEVSPMRQIASVQSISGAGFKKIFNLGGTGSGWVGETASRPQTASGTFGIMTYTPGEIYANPAATQQILDDSEIDLEAWLASEVEKEFSLQEGIAFVAGNGVNKPTGFLTYATGAANAAAHPFGAIPVSTTAAAAAFTSDELIDLVYSLPGALSQNARFVMNRPSLARIRKLKDGDGNYLWQPSYQAGQPQQVLAFPVTEMAAMPNVAADAYPIAFGDFKRGYLIVDRLGIRVLRDPYTNKPYVHFYTTKRVGGGLLDPQALRVLKMAAA